MKLYFSRDQIELDARLTAEGLRRVSGGSIQDAGHKSKDGPDFPVFWAWAGSRAEISDLPADAKPFDESSKFDAAYRAWLEA
jgi:hypothetical protein